MSKLFLWLLNSKIPKYQKSGISFVVLKETYVIIEKNILDVGIIKTGVQ
jgi:hypothetical protein